MYTQTIVYHQFIDVFGYCLVCTNQCNRKCLFISQRNSNENELNQEEN